jgi:hypothetical protein
MIVSGAQSYPLPFHRAMATAQFRFEAVAGRPLQLMLLHPAAIPEHDRSITRYDFRRLGVVVKSIRLRPATGTRDAAASVSGAPATTVYPPEGAVSGGGLPDAADFNHVLSAYAAHFPYSAGGPLAAPAPGARTPLLSQGALHRFVGHKRDLHFGELLPFEGAEFADAAAWALCGRSATPDDRRRMELDRGAPNRVAFALELDQQNRKDKAVTRLHGLKFGRRLWRTERFLRRKNMALPAKWANGLLRRYSRVKVRSLMLDASQRLLILTMLDNLSAQQARGD